MATLVRVMPDQIADIWELIENAIAETSISPITDEILEGLLLNHYVCWAGMEKDAIKIIVITRVVDETFLLIHTAYTYGNLRGGDYVKLYGQLNEYAKTVGCKNIILYTENDKLCEFAKAHGASVSKFIMVPV